MFMQSVIRKSSAMLTQNRNCIFCQKPMLGRTDKKFCNDFCRNAHHNQISNGENACVRVINTFLKRNRRILENLLYPQLPHTQVPRQQLIHRGFSFAYFTHSMALQKGDRGFFCYEYGYRYLEGEQVLIMRSPEMTDPFSVNPELLLVNTQ
jgi:hypothetical protein